MPGEKQQDNLRVQASGQVDVSGNIVTADVMSFQKAIIDKIRKKRGDFLIELKVNQRILRYGIEDRVGLAVPVDVHSEGPCLEHGRIETRTCRISILRFNGTGQ